MNKIIATVLLCLAGHAVFADTKSEIVTRYNKQVEAYKRNDQDAEYSVCSKDYWEKSSSGKRTLKQALAQDKQYAKYFVSGDVSFNIDSLKEMGDKAVVQITVRSHSIWIGKDKKKHHWTTDGQYTDTWVKGAKGWMLQSDVETFVKSTKDGKPVKG